MKGAVLLSLVVLLLLGVSYGAYYVGWNAAARASQQSIAPFCHDALQRRHAAEANLGAPPSRHLSPPDDCSGKLREISAASVQPGRCGSRGKPCVE